MVLAGLIFAGIALWPSFGAQKDGHESLTIAAWTALKDYTGYCSHEVCPRVHQLRNDDHIREAA